MPSVANNGMRVEVRVNGLQDIRDKLLALSKDEALKLVRGAMKDGAEVVRQEAVRNLVAQRSVRTGALAKSVIIRSGRANGPNKLSGYEEWAGVTIARTVFEARLDEGKLVRVPQGKKPASGAIRPRSYAHLIEFGVRPHTTGEGDKLEETVLAYRRDARGKLRPRTIRTGGKGVQAGRFHKGFAARPFMRPAYNTKQFEAHAVLVQSARTRLTELVSRIARKTRRTAA